jgi:hypothetical protein
MPNPFVDGEHLRAVHLQMLKKILKQMIHRIPNFYWVGLLMLTDLSRSSGDTDASASLAEFYSAVRLKIKRSAFTH